MATLDEETDRLVRMAWAPRTLQAYEVGISKFKQFRRNLGCINCDAPANHVEITRFISTLSIENKAPATIAAYISAISNWHKTQEYEDPCDNFLVKKALKGGFRRPSDVPLREPITLDLLKRLVGTLKSICSSKWLSSDFLELGNLFPTQNIALNDQ